METDSDWTGLMKPYSNITRHALIGLVFTYFLFLILFPLSSMFIQSFQNSWDGFLSELTKPEALFALKLTLIVAVIATLLNVVLGGVVAYVLVRYDFFGKSFFNSLVDLPIAIPTVVAGLTLILLYGPNSIIGAFFGKFGMQIIFAFPGIILATLFVTFPFMVRSVEPMLEEIERESEEAAKTLGASNLQIFWYVTLPAIKRGILSGATLTFARALGEFGAVIMVSGIIIMKTQTAPLYVYAEAENFNPTGASVISVILAIASFSMLFILDYILKKEVA